MKNFYSLRFFIGLVSLFWLVLSGQFACAQKPTISGFSAIVNPICAGTPATFTATVGNVTGSYNYTLTNGSSPLSGTATGNFSQSLTASGSGPQSYTLTVASAGQSTTATTSLTQLPSGVTRLYVKANASGANTGLSWQDAFTDLQLALKYPCLGSLREIWIARGVYKPRSVNNLDDAFSLLPDVAIYGGFEGTETDLSQRPPITLSNPSSTTLSADVDGDGTPANNSYFLIYNTRRLTSTASLDGVVITPPSSGSGFGTVMNNSNGNPNETSPELRFGSESSPQYRNLLFTGNNSSISVVNTGIKGGITRPSFINCVFRDNPFALVFNQGNDYSSGVLSVVAPQFVNCVITNNMNGPGIPFLNISQINSTDQSAFINCSFLNVPTGVVATNTDGLSQNDIRLTNCVLWNTGGANTFTKANANSLLNVTVQYSLLDQAITSYTSGPGNLTTTSSPFMSATSAQLLDCSPAINTGSNQAYTAVNGPTTDIAGNPRQYNGGVIDRGAYEYQGNPTSLTVGNPSVMTATINQPFSQSFTTSGGSGQYSYSVVSSNLPTSLSVSSAGVLSGTPTVAGSYSVLVQVSDANGCVGVASAAYSLTVSSVALPCGTVVFVTQNGAGLQNGSSWANAFAGTALQTAINTATTCGAQVWVAQGLYKPTTGTDPTISFVLKAGVAIYGGFVGTEGQLGERPAVNPVTGQPSSSTLSGDIGTPGDSGLNSDNSGHVVRSEPGLTASAVLDGFVITKGRGSDGSVSNGGGMSNSGASPTVRNCFFIDNYVFNSGGGIYNENSSPTIENCRFEANSAINGGAIYNKGTGTITITGCLFEKHNEGGAIYSNDNSRVVVGTSTFRQNTGYAGGAFGSRNNTALELTDCLLENNTSEDEGGAIYHQNTGSIKLTRCQFINNSASNEYGGAVYVQDASLEATGCRFTGNSAVAEAGGIYFTGQNQALKLTNCVFENNRGEGGDGGGAVFVNGGSATIINSHFVSNTATNGGAVCFNGTNQQVTNSSFVGNVATEHGGAISNGSATLQLTNSSFQGNQAPQGGAVYSDYGRSQLVNSVFFNNGGANTFVLEDGFSPSLAASFSVFESGATGYSDAGNNLLSTVSPFVSATSTQLRDCSPAINTGSNQAYSTANGPATDLAGNARQYNGGVIDRGAYEYQGNPTLLTVSNPAISTATVGQVFSQPFTASGGGSGQYSYSVVSSNLPTSLSVSSAGVLSGTPTVAGSYSVLVQVSDANGCVGVASAAYSLTVSNVALPCGTVVFVTQNGAGLQNGSNWANAFAGTALQTAINTATTCGAQVWVAQGLYKPTTGTNRSISFVMKPGVAIYGGFRGTEGQLGDRPTIIPIANQPSSSTLSGDLSGDDGPDFANNADNSYHVIKNDNNGLDNTAVLDGFVISGGNANGNNSTDERGGAIYSFSSSPRLINCSLQSNSALVNGGAIYDTGSSFSLINCSFQQNTADRGGAIYINASNPILINCWFQANTVTSNGGAIYNNISNPSLVNCSLQNNTATVGGGAIYNQGNRNVNNTISLINSVLFNNGGANTFMLTDGGSLSASYSLFEPSVTGYTDGGNNLTTTITPFVSGNSVALNACSPAINSGSNQAYSVANGPTIDIAGNPRFVNTVIDRGAYEYPSVPTSLTVVNPSVTTATMNQPFSQSFTASGGSGTYSFSVVSSNLPASLSLSGYGVLSGTPTQAGSYSVLVSVSDANGCVGTASTAYNLVVTDATPTITGFAVVPNRVCVGSPITFTATIGNIAGSYSWSLENGGPPIGSPSPTTATAFNVVLTALGSGVQTFTLTVNSGGQRVTATTSLTVNALPIASLINNGPLTCAQTSVTLTASGGTSYSFTNSSGQVVPGSGNTRTVSSPGTFSVTVGDVNGCVSTTSTTVSQNLTNASVSISPSSATLTNATPSVSLTAVGSGMFLWSTGETSAVISVTTSGTYSVTLTSPGGCTASASVPVVGSDLTVTLELPQANFAAPGSVGNFLVNVFEVAGLPTSSGNVRITLTAPVGYTLSFASSLTSIQVSGGSSVPIDNSQWTVTNSLANRQLTLTMNSGAFINGGGESSLGFSITRTNANSGSTASITVNVADDLTMTYDGNLSNNVYARVINGL